MIINTRHVLCAIFSFIIILFLINHCEAQFFQEGPPPIQYQDTVQSFDAYDLQENLTIVDEYDDEEIIPVVHPFREQRVVLLGDSQTIGPLGVVLEQHFLEDSGVSTFNRIGMRGWGFYRWNRHRERIDSFIQNNRPTIILILMGGNDWSRAHRSDIDRTIEDFWNYIHEVGSTYSRGRLTVCWIESPAIIEAASTRTRAETREITEGRFIVSQAIERVIGSNFFVNTSDTVISTGRAEDGIHFRTSGAEIWYQQVMPRIETCVENQRIQF